MSRSASPLRSFVRACGGAVLLSLAACATTTPTARAPAGEARGDVVTSPTVPDETPPPEPILFPQPTAPEAQVAETTEPPVSAPEPTLATGREVFDRIRARLRAPACIDSARVRAWQKRYAGHPTVFTRKVGSILPLLEFVVAETERSGLPGEFVFIPLVESWYEPGAVGRGGPTGMWQMIGSTARNHGVGIRKGYDGRLSPVDSTRAALSYLETLGDMFDDDWQAMVMAYNAGEYRLAGALRRSGSRRVSGFDGVPAGLSQITYDYVAKLQALSCLVAEPERHGLVLPDTVSFERLAPVLVPAGLRGLDQVAARSGVPAERLRAWNPAYRSGRIVEGAPRVLLMPLAASPRLAAPVDADATTLLASADVATPAGDEADADQARTHEVRSGDTLSRIAQRYGVSLRSLRELNRLGKSSHIRPGQVLRLVP